MRRSSNPGNTLYYTEPVEANPVNQLESLRELCADMDAGKVDTLLILGGNPVYDTPHDFDFASKLRQGSQHGPAKSLLRRDLAALPLARRGVALPGSLGRRSRVRRHRQRDSAVDCAALRHALRARCAGGLQRQAGRQRLRRDPRPSEDRGRQRRLREVLAQDAERRRGGELGATRRSASARSSILAACPPRKPAQPEELEFIFRPDPCVYDGRFANNGWLQELPKPLTKLTWDNAAMVSPNTAEKLGLTHRVAARGGEHGQILSNVIDIALSNSKVTAAAWILPGHADGVIVLPLGYGRTFAGYTGTNKGFNANAVRSSQRAVDRARRQDQQDRRRISAWPARSITSTWKAARF